MSSLPPSGVRSREAERAGPDLAQASLVRLRGAPLLDALERHAPGSRSHACDTALAAPGTDSLGAGTMARRQRAIEELRGTSGLELDRGVVDALAEVLERAAA